MTTKNRVAHAAPLALILALAGPGGAADNPTVDFAVADGWVNLRLYAGDTPVTDAKIMVFVGDTVWAEGETGATGTGTFQRPKADHCQVVFLYTTGASAPVPLTFSGDAVTPASAPVGGARPPCCLVAPPYTPAASQPDPLSQSRYIVFAVVLVVLGAVAFVAYRVTMIRTAPPNGESA